MTEYTIDMQVIEDLKKEMTSEAEALKSTIEAVKAEYQAKIDERDEEIKKITEMNKALQSDLVRHALTDAKPEPEEKSEDEKYNELIEERKKVVLQLMQDLE